MSVMQTLVVGILIAIVAIAVALPVFFLLVNGAAFLQPRDKAVIREKGHRRLGEPVDAKPLAEAEIPFALISEVAYQKANQIGNNQPHQPTPVELALKAAHWEQWPPYFAPDVQANFAKHNLRVEVWQNASARQLVVAFGGTDPKKIEDWIANFRWFLHSKTDEYTLVVKEFGKLFGAELIKRSQTPDSEWLRHAKLIATGHSLGGGLAQQFAYSLPMIDGVQRVKEVYAFDSSPVTGYFSVDERLRDNNKEGLSIDRIYQRREILAILRSAVNLVHPPSTSSPKIREIRFNFAQNWNPVFRHSITQLRQNLQSIAAGGQKSRLHC